MGSDTHTNNTKLLWRSHSLSAAQNLRRNFYQNSIRSVCLTPFLIDLYTLCLSLRQHSVTHRQHSFRTIQSHNWQKVYFLKRSLSSITPSEVVWRVSLSISMHSFNRGSDVRNPVDLSAYYNKTRITKWKDMLLQSSYLLLSIYHCKRSATAPSAETLWHFTHSSAISFGHFGCILCQTINVIWNPVVKLHFTQAQILLSHAIGTAAFKNTLLHIKEVNNNINTLILLTTETALGGKQ